MTPQSRNYTPSVEDASEPPVSEVDSGDESLPPHTSEIGTLKKLPNHGTAWLGSSSGVYFVNTVRRAFSAALVDLNANSAIPATEDILTGEGEDGRNYNGPVTDGPSLTDGSFRRGILAVLGRPPTDRSLAMDLVTSFFKCWHPLFPFLHGPRFLQDVDFVYAMKSHDDPGKYNPQESRKLITFQLIINIASLDRSDLHLPVESRIKSTADVTRVAGCFSVNHDIAAIQLLIAAELYLVATISLRQASTVAGMILKLIYHAGLHRCPLRYAQLSLEDCEIRKRIFWSAYALDRHLSLSLGDPNTVQDNDIDVCLSGRELHKAVAHELIIDPSEEIKMHLPHPHSGPHGTGSPSDDPRVVNLNDGPQAREKQQREAAMTAYVHYGKLTGQIIEIFHKSIHARFQKPDAITFLNSDIETWWNDLPSSLTEHGDDEDYNPSVAHSKPGSQSTTPSNPGDSNEHGAGTGPAHTPGSTSTSTPTHRQLAPFFMILYQQLLLLLNRPRLSLDQSTAEFQHGLQVCIKASRNSLAALKKHRENGQSMLLPGLLSAAWMAGLIIAFACQLGKYPKQRACQDISSCLGIVESMGCSNWFTVKNCHKVLSLLLENIKSRRASSTGFLTTALSHQHQPQRGESGFGTSAGSIPRKRTHEENPNKDIPDLSASPKRKSTSEASPASSADFRMPPPRTPTLPTTSISNTANPSFSQRQQLSNTALNPQPSSQSDRSNVSNTTSTQSKRNTRSNTSQRDSNSPYAKPNKTFPQSTSTDTPMGNTALYPQSSLSSKSASGSALYTDPQDIAYAQSSHSLPIPSSSSSYMNPATTNFNPNASMNMSGVEDPLFWGNFDYNVTDIFGAASFETLSGGSGLVGDASGMGMGGGMGGGMGFDMGMGGMNMMGLSVMGMSSTDGMWGGSAAGFGDADSATGTRGNKGDGREGVGDDE